jgi:ABC-2 type transport system permease protein
VNGARAIARNELRLLRHDPVPAAILVGMPLVLMVLLQESLGAVLALDGNRGAPGSAQAVPGLACVFAFFVVAIVGFAIFREHGWATWPRLRAAGLSSRAILLGKLAVPAALLAGQHVLLFAFGVAFLDLSVAGSWAAIALVALAFSLLVLLAGLAAAATLATVQQLNAVTNLAAMIVGGLGGGFVPTSTLPDWIEPLAPVSPVYWAMEGYRDAIFDGAGVGGVLGPVAVLLAFAAAFGGVALWRLRIDVAKRGWG